MEKRDPKQRGTDPQETPVRLSLRDGDKDRLLARVVHPLPAAQAFAGREEELKRLGEFWQGGGGVVSLIGIGGAGKTALTQRFLDTQLINDPPDGMLVWSFYDDPDANQFLKTAYEYFTGGSQAQASGAGWFSLLSEVLASGKRFLMILDGLERVQRQDTDSSGIYGELEDPLLKGLLLRIAAGAGNTKAIITSRFPVSSIERFSGRGYSSIDVNQLVGDAANKLIDSHKVYGTDRDIQRLIKAAGGHALTIDLLAGAAAKFFDFDASNLPEIPEPVEDKQEVRLTNVLDIYEKNLEPVDLDLLKCLCVFRFGVDRETLKGIFVGESKSSISGKLATATDAQIDSALTTLVDSHLVYAEKEGKFTIHPSVRDHFYRLFRDPTKVHGVVQEHLTSLTRRPGIGLPTDKDSLDLLEELVHHAIQAKSEEEAEEIYFSRLGGSEHLSTSLGEYLRTFRILSSFEECPDRTGMYHCHRAFGNFEGALKWRPNNRYILIIRGELKSLAQDKSVSTSFLARALRGEDVRIPDRTPDVPICASLVYLLRGELSAAQRVASTEVNSAVFADDQVRNKLVLADVARQQNDLETAKRIIEECSDWILNSASQEHLCLYNWIRSRILLASGQIEAAKQSLEEALNSSRECWFHLLEAVILIDRARIRLSEKDRKNATKDAKEALKISSKPETGFAYGISAAQEILDEIKPPK